jgi:hypothetical protein
MDIKPLPNNEIMKEIDTYLRYTKSAVAVNSRSWKQENATVSSFLICFDSKNLFRSLGKESVAGNLEKGN